MMNKRRETTGDKMREIKFRIWDETQKEMLRPDDDNLLYPVVHIDGVAAIYINEDGGKGGLWEHEIRNDHKLIPMQFTGLRDKNNKEIYEGDIVTMPDNTISGENIIAEVVFKNCAFGFYHGRFYTFAYEWDDETDTDCIEVIGNIYENLELLKY